MAAIGSNVTPMAIEVIRDDVLRYRVRAQQLDRAGEHSDASILDLGVQDTGYDGAAWALAIRGADFDADDHFLAWTIRGAPHAYRRSEAAAVARATSPWSDADAAKRVFDGAKPLKQAGIPILEALDAVAEQMRDIVSSPTVKGDMSSELTERMPEAYRRWCRPCEAVHLYEQVFRLSALRAGLELQADTSPPVLRRLPRWRGLARRAPDHLDPIRAVLHLLGPTTPKSVAGFLDTAVREVKARWPEDIVDVMVEGVGASILASDVDALMDADVEPDPDAVRLLGNYDLFLQTRDRDLLVADADRRKALWPVLGRPGAVLIGHDIGGLWRPRTSGPRLRIEVEPWSRWSNAVMRAVEDQAERLADFRDLEFSGVHRS